MGSVFVVIASSCGEGCCLWLLFGEYGVCFGVWVRLGLGKGACVLCPLYLLCCVCFLGPFSLFPGLSPGSWPLFSSPAASPLGSWPLLCRSGIFSWVLRLCCIPLVPLSLAAGLCVVF